MSSSKVRVFNHFPSKDFTLFECFLSLFYLTWPVIGIRIDNV